MTSVCLKFSLLSLDSAHGSAILTKPEKEVGYGTTEAQVPTQTGVTGNQTIADTESLHRTVLF